MITVILIALSLALDATSISVTCGLTVPDFKIKNAIILGLYFGVFQTGMTLLGYYVGIFANSYVSKIGPYIAFALLLVIGGKMIYNSFRKDKVRVATKLTTVKMLIFALATSIDAFAVGITFALTDREVIIPSIIIGMVAFLLSVAGGLTGKKLSGIFKNKAELVGGVVLLLIGINILIN